MRRKKQNSNYEEKIERTEISGGNSEDRLWRNMKKCFGYGSEAALWASVDECVVINCNESINLLHKDPCRKD